MPYDRPSATIDEILARVAAARAAEGRGLQPPCPPARLAALRERCARELGMPLPDSYAALLARADGVVWNGTTFFPSERVPIAGQAPTRYLYDLVEMNLARLDIADEVPEVRDWLMLGDSGPEMYAYAISTERYQVVDQVSLDTLEDYATLDELFAAAYTKRLPEVADAEAHREVP